MEKVFYNMWKKSFIAMKNRRYAKMIFLIIFDKIGCGSE